MASAVNYIETALVRKFARFVDLTHHDLLPAERDVTLAASGSSMDPTLAMKCPGCEHENAVAAKFCEQCGLSLARVCSHCGGHPSATAKFCAQCGHPLEPVAGDPRFGRQILVVCDCAVRHTNAGTGRIGRRRERRDVYKRPVCR